MIEQIRDTLRFVGAQLKKAGKILADVGVKPPENACQKHLGMVTNAVGNVLLVLVLGFLLRTVIWSWLLFAVSLFAQNVAYGVIGMCVLAGGTALFIRVFIQGVGLVKAYFLFALYGAIRGYMSFYKVLHMPEAHGDFWIAFKELIGVL